MAYEPYIFAALNSAKVMVVLGTRPEYFNAVWVRNEWSRYLSLVKASNGKKILIPAYRDMDPYDLPEEFSHLQAQDMSKLGFMQDLIRGIKKITHVQTTAKVIKQTTNPTVEITTPNSLLKRAFLFLQDAKWDEANGYCEKVLDLNPENAEAYLCKLLADYQIKNIEELKHTDNTFVHNDNYKKVLLFADEELKNQIVDLADSSAYEYAVNKMQSGKYTAALPIFEKISYYKDSLDMIKKCNEELAKLDKICVDWFMEGSSKVREAIKQYDLITKKYKGYRKNAIKVLWSCLAAMLIFIFIAVNTSPNISFLAVLALIAIIVAASMAGIYGDKTITAENNLNAEYEDINNKYKIHNITKSNIASDNIRFAFMINVGEKIIMNETIDENPFESFTWSIDDSSIADMNEREITGNKTGITLVHAKTKDGKVYIRGYIVVI